MPHIVFACVHNAGRSQMAAAWFNHLAAPGAARRQTPNATLAGAGPVDDTQSVTAISAGTSPAERVHPEVVEVMKEVGIDLSSARPQKLTPELLKDAQLLVTMGCGDECPYVPGLKVEDWPLEDPKGKPIERVREIRDEIRRRVASLLGL
jgi:arsenate reductase (thioredoxin)